MKRVLLKPLHKYVQNNAVLNLDKDSFEMGKLQDISDFIAELRLLKDVPFSYLVADEKLIPPESIRFFYLDENWLNALTDGVGSIGRISNVDAHLDQKYFGYMTQRSTTRLANPRFQIMHPNHRRTNEAVDVSGSVRTGFILRSELVAKWKGLETFGYHEDTLLPILRMDVIMKNFLICIFDGELTKFVVSEPKTGLRFGAPDNSGVITLRDPSDNDNFGYPLKDKQINLNEFTNQNGKIRVSELAGKMKNMLNTPVKSSQFAYELIAVAKRAEFLKGGD